MSEYINNFSAQEVQTARDILACVDGAPSSSKLRRMVMLLLKGHYSHPENYGAEYEHLACYRHTSDKDSTLQVGFTHLNNDKNPDDFPGIYVGFGGVTLSKVAMGDVSGRTDDNSGTHVTKQATLTLLVNHVAKEAGDAYDLADMSATLLMALGRPMVLSAGALELSVEGYAEPKKEVQAPNRYYTVAMTVKISYNHAVTRSIESHRIRRIVAMVDPA